MRLNKIECMDSMRDEYNRLGRRLDGINWTPDQITQHVAQLFSNSVKDTPSAFPAESTPAPLENVTEQQGPYFFVTGVGEDGQWKLEAYNCTNGELGSSVALPDPIGSFYSISFSVTEGFLLVSPGQSPVPCSDIMIAPDATAPPPKSAVFQHSPPPALPPGVAAFSAKLPGMGGHGGPGVARLKKHLIIWSNRTFS